MAAVRRNITRQRWLLLGVSLVFLVAHLARITPTCGGTTAQESPVRSHESKPRGRRTKPLGDYRKPPYRTYGRKQEVQPAPSTEHSVTAGAVKGPKGKARSTLTDEVTQQSRISALGDHVPSRITHSTGVSPPSDNSPSPAPVPALRSSTETEESDASADLHNVNPERDEGLQVADHTAISLPADTPPEDSASLESAPAPPPNNTGITVTSTSTTNPPTSTGGFQGTSVFKDNAAPAPPPLRREPTLPPEGLVDLLIPFITYPTEVARSSNSQHKSASGGTYVYSHGRRLEGIASPGTFAWRRLLQAKDLEDQTDARSRKEPAETCRRIEFLQAKVAEHTSDFEAAAQRACSPSTYAAYVDLIQNKMDGTLGNLEDLIGNATSGWLDNSFGYEDLSALLQDNISVWEYIKKNPVFLALVCVAIVLLFAWLFCCTPKVCCRCCRRLCFCIPERMHKIGFMGRLIFTIIGAVALLIIVVFAILAATTQYSGIGGVRALQCHVYTTVGEIINGSNTTTVDPNEQFVGVSPLFRELKELSAKLDTSAPDSIVTDLRTQVKKDLDFSHGIASSKGYLNALQQALVDSANEIGTLHHVCQACEAAKPSKPMGTALNALQTAISSPDLNMSTKVDELFNQFTFPSIVLDDVVPVGEMEVALKNVTDALVEAEPSVTSGLTYTDAAFGVAYAFVFLMACIGVAWIVFFFFRGAKTRSAPACVQWNVLCFSMFLILLVAGIIGFATNTALRGCEYANKELVVEDKWDDLMGKIDPESGDFSHLIKGCFGKAGAGNLIDILGYRDEYDKMISEVDSALDDLVSKVPSTPSVAVKGTEKKKNRTELQIV